MLIDDHNVFNKIGQLAILWTVRHHWPAGAWFAFNCYKHYVQLLIIRPENSPAILLSQKGVTQDDTLLMVLHGINPLPPGRVALVSIPRSPHPPLHRKLCIQWIGAAECESPQAYPGVDTSPNRLIMSSL